MYRDCIPVGRGDGVPSGYEVCGVPASGIKVLASSLMAGPPHLKLDGWIRVSEELAGTSAARHEPRIRAVESSIMDTTPSTPASPSSRTPASLFPTLHSKEEPTTQGSPRQARVKSKDQRLPGLYSHSTSSCFTLVPPEVCHVLARQTSFRTVKLTAQQKHSPLVKALDGFHSVPGEEATCHSFHLECSTVGGRRHDTTGFTSCTGKQGTPSAEKSVNTSPSPLFLNL